MKLQKQLFIFLFFFVLATKTITSYTCLFSDTEMEQVEDLDEEDPTDEEDTEKENREKDGFYSEFYFRQIHLETHLFQSESNLHYALHSYISPIPDTLFSPPDMA
jgi:hypothetical protein